MPLKLVPPRKGKTPNFYVRGTYLKVYVDESTGTGERRVAKQRLGRIKEAIERGEFERPSGPTFADAAVKYMEAGGERRFLGPLLQHFKELDLASIDQQAINDAAQALYPNATPATRNRQVYTPVQAVLKHAGVRLELKRPKGSAGVLKTDWLWPEQAFALFREADKIDAEFGVFLRFLTYTGVRLSEALALKWSEVRLEDSYAYVPLTKPGTPRAVYLPSILHKGLLSIKREGGRVFRFTKSGRLYSLLKEAKLVAGLPDYTFHQSRHTWASWMRRFAGLDTKGLIATGAWTDTQAAERYQHAVVSEESRKADLLPTEPEDEV